MRVALLVVMLAGAAMLRAQDAPKPAEDPAIAAARKRQDLIKTLKVTFKRTDFLPRGSQTDLAAGGPVEAAGVVPEQDTTLTSENLVMLDGKKFLYENSHPTYLMPSGELLQQTRIGVTDGLLAKTLISGERQKHKASGMIDGRAICREARSVEIAPLILFARALEPTLASYPFVQFKPTGGSLKVGGVECKEYVRTSGGMAVHYWLDPSRGHVVVRMQLRMEGAMIDQTGIEYGPHPVTGMKPTGWVNSHFKKTGELLRTTRIVVGEPTMNEPIPAGTFSPDFPPNSAYSDRRDGKEYEIREDGSRWEFDPSRRKPPVPADAPWWGGWPVWPLALAAVVLGAALWLVFRKRA